jgi:UDP-N-acetylmuramoyl-tripeptide--D-alanyl-D-alanine ligase
MPTFISSELAAWCAGEWVMGNPEVIRGIVHDTRQVQPGFLFVAIPGSRVDGHDLVGEAAARGAVAALVTRERLARVGRHLPCLVVDNTVKALGGVAAGYRRRLGLRVVGVTGSVGKTTVKEMIAGMLATTFPTARTQGNWNNDIGLPLSLLQVPEEARMAVLELGISHPGEMEPLCDIAGPDWGVISNVGPVHLEFFSSVEAIAREKGILFSSLPPAGTAVLGIDDPHYELLRSLAPCRVLSVSLKGGADYVLMASDESHGTNRVLEQASGEVFEFCMPVPGRHHLHNALLAMAVARGCGVKWESVAAGLAQYQAPPMRWQRLEAGGVVLINDAYNANPLSMRAAIRTFAETAVKGGRWLVLGDMRELGAGEVTEHEAVGQLIGSGDWRGLVAVGRLGGHFADGAMAAGLDPARIVRCETAELVAGVLSGQVRPGDAVLFKASRGVHLETAVEKILADLNKCW